MPKSTMSRRALLTAAALMGAGAALAPRLALAEVGFGRTDERDGQFEVARTALTMGTVVTLKAHDASRDLAEEAVTAGFAEIRRLCSIFDRHQDGTEISALNRAGALVGAHPELVAVAERAKDMTRLTSGAFDATILPVAELLKNHLDAQGRLDVSRRDLAEALALVDGGKVVVDGREIRFAKPGMALTLDGIGKGYIVDKACAAMAATGVTGMMVDAGGDIRVAGPRRWHIAVEDPKRAGHYPSVLSLANCAVATSGGYERPLDASGKHNHIIDPASGMSPTQTVSVSTVAPTAMEADALSTAVMVLPAKAGIGLVDSLPGRECLVLGLSGARLASGNWHRLERA